MRKENDITLLDVTKCATFEKITLITDPLISALLFDVYHTFNVIRYAFFKQNCAQFLCKDCCKSCKSICWTWNRSHLRFQIYGKRNMFRAYNTGKYLHVRHPPDRSGSQIRKKVLNLNSHHHHHERVVRCRTAVALRTKLLQLFCPVPFFLAQPSSDHIFIS